MRLFWSRSAIIELDHISAYITYYNPAAAIKIRKQIMLSARKLVEFPEIGRAAKRPGVRLLVVSGLPYILAYEVKRDIIEIGSVIDGRMNRSTDLW